MVEKPSDRRDACSPSSEQSSGAEAEAFVKAHADVPPLEFAFFRVMRALMFEERPQPELDALPLAQLRLIWSVTFMPDATMKDYSERLSVSQSTVTQLAERLVRRNMVLRQPDATDRRVVRLRLTEVGQKIMNAAKGAQHQTFLQVWEMLSTAERDQVMNGLRILGRTGEAVRAAQGRPLPSLHEPMQGGSDRPNGSVERAQPVMDLMARRVRGGNG